MTFKIEDAEQNYEGLYTIYANTTHHGRVFFTLDIDEVIKLANKKKKKVFWKRFKLW
jgi:hypothetical protein